jgi:sigma-B regulation protein RsbU (phosphoserine phosphatase)
MEKEYNHILSLMAEKLSNPIMILNSEQIIVYTNEIMRETFGNLVGKHKNFIMGDDESGEMAVPTAEIDKEGRIEAVLADVTYSILVSKVSDCDGENYTVLLFEDISEKHHLEEQLKQNLKKYQLESGIARHIQNSILPINNEYWNMIRLNGIYLPADELGGDVYDIVKLNEDEVLLYIADVSGHGIQAALLTMFIREKVRANTHEAIEGLELLLSKLLKGFQELDIDAMLYLSILFCKYNGKKHELSIANAGHNCYPLVIRQSGRIEEIPVRGMPISKISDSSSYEEEVLVMRPGDRVILYTDGVIEEYSKAEQKIFGSEGVRRVAEALYDLEGSMLAERIIAEAKRYTMVAAKDDRTIVVADFL